MINLKKNLLILVSLSFIFPLAIYAADNDGEGGGIEEHKLLLEESLKKPTEYSRGMAHLKKAIKYQKKEKEDKAIIYYKKSINYFLAHNKKYYAEAEIFYFLGFAHEKIKDLENALLYYEIGLEMIKECKCKEYDELKKKISEIES